jgi:hypothetical protein
MTPTRLSTQTPDGPLNTARARGPLLDAHAAAELLGVPHTWLLREARAHPPSAARPVRQVEH